MSKSYIVAMALLAMFLTLPAVPAMGDDNDLYDNGPINGNAYAWAINFGYAVSDTFTLSEDSVVGGVSFGAWLFPDDQLTSAEVSITSSELGGTSYFDGTVNFSQGRCFTDSFGYNVCRETGSFSPVGLSVGTYWLNMQNAQVPSGNPVYWDENSGPSRASENELGTIPSEAFTINNWFTTTTTRSTPEPSSIMLVGSGILGLVGFLRRKPS